jgi:cytochrome c556
MRSPLRTLLAPLVPIVVAACVPHRDLPPAEIVKLQKLSDVMDVQATVADPQFKKMDQGAYSDADWAGFADCGARLQVTSMKAKDFSKGPRFDALAQALHDDAASLSAAAQNKDAAGAAKALSDMKAACKLCHHEFR